MARKKEGSMAPLLEVVQLSLTGLVAQVLTSGEATCQRTGCIVNATASTRCRETSGRTAGRIRDHQSQIAHGEVACAKIADERKPVSILEPANRNHVTREPTRYVVERGGYQSCIGSA